MYTTRNLQPEDGPPCIYMYRQYLKQSCDRIQLLCQFSLICYYCILVHIHRICIAQHVNQRAAVRCNHVDVVVSS